MAMKQKELDTMLDELVRTHDPESDHRAHLCDHRAEDVRGHWVLENSDRIYSAVTKYWHLRWAMDSA